VMLRDFKISYIYVNLYVNSNSSNVNSHIDFNLSKR
jgi:hypothetical protein